MHTRKTCIPSISTEKCTFTTEQRIFTSVPPKMHVQLRFFTVQSIIIPHRIPIKYQNHSAGLCINMSISHSICDLMSQADRQFVSMLSGSILQRRSHPARTTTCSKAGDWISEFNTNTARTSKSIVYFEHAFLHSLFVCFTDPGVNSLSDLCSSVFS